MEACERNKLRRKWLEMNWLAILLASIATMAFLIGAIIFHKIIFVIVGIVLGFTSLFWGRNKMMAYIEKNI